jgi:hypothetical protein
MKDINRDGSAKNDILYIPRNQSEIKLQNIVRPIQLVSAAEQWNQLDAYINNDYLNASRNMLSEMQLERLGTIK